MAGFGKIFCMLVCITSGVLAKDGTAGGMDGVEQGEYATAMCYIKMFKFLLSGTEDPLTSDGRLNYNVTCPAMQLMADCMAGLDVPSSFVVDANRFINWQICALDSKFLCPGGLACDALGNVTKDTDIVKAYMSEAMVNNEGDDQYDGCTREWEHDCNVMYIRSVKRVITIQDYYKCYVDAYKACPSTDLQHISKLNEGLLTPGSSLHDMEQTLSKRIEGIMRLAAAQVKHQEL